MLVVYDSENLDYIKDGRRRLEVEPGEVVMVNSRWPKKKTNNNTSSIGASPHCSERRNNYNSRKSSSKELVVCTTMLSLLFATDVTTNARFT